MHNFGWTADGAPAPENSMPWGRCDIGFNSAPLLAEKTTGLIEKETPA
jgi:hypothetical protein